MNLTPCIGGKTVKPRMRWLPILRCWHCWGMQIEADDPDMSKAYELWNARLMRRALS